MTQQERTILNVKLRGFTIGIALSIMGATIVGVWTASRYYYGVLEAIEKGNSANAVQDARITNLENRADNDEESIRRLSQNMKP